MGTADSTLAATVPGVRVIHSAAAERYEVQPYYRRFDQKYNMVRQGLWRVGLVPPETDLLINRTKLVRKGIQGYTLLDWAFASAAQASPLVSCFDHNVPNRGPTSWKPLGPPPPEGIGKWSASPATNSRVLKKVARLFGAGDVGITLLDRRWVYSNWFDEKTRQSYPIRFSDEPGYAEVNVPTCLDDLTQVVPANMKYVAVFIIPMNRQGIAAAPTLTEMATTLATYSEIGRLLVSVAEFIRSLGYNAIPSSNCTALSVPLAIDAGLGELGRHAKLIHPVWGPVCRICKIITDLPLVPDTPIASGATTFCDSCGKCADACPARAIPKGPRSFEPAGDFSSAGVRQWQIDHAKCYQYWHKVGTNCGICVRVCPYNKSTNWSHQVTKAVIARFPVFNPLIARLDDALGYGKAQVDTFWFDNPKEHPAAPGL